MKQKFLKTVATVVMLMLFTAVPCITANAAGITEFSDVSKDYWGYEMIMEMAKAGIFRGTTDPINGVGTFSPEKVMTRAEFITASLRSIYPEETKDIENGKTKWWNGYYIFALQKGIVKGDELNSGDLDLPMTREEMAMIMVRCVEKNGEKLTRRIEATNIPDHSKIGSYYKDYVIDCFSFGLLCGMDDKGTFAPTRSLTRAEAATVILRLLDKDTRIEVEFDDPTVENDGDGFESDDYPPENPGVPSVPEAPVTPEPEKPEPLPWENGGKQPSEYTWAEYEALSDSLKSAFCESFESQAAFDNWLKGVSGSQENESELPWENGGKRPSEYTWAEYEALPDAVKNAFYDSFENKADFDAWFSKVQGSQEPESELPWENGGKQPSEYTWAEYEALPDAIKNAFYDSFENRSDFDAWFSKVQTPQNSNSNLPWENGGKKPSEYTWAEFEALSDTMKNAFVDAFEKAEDFAKWLNANQP